jgi:hypothetical protein
MAINGSKRWFEYKDDDGLGYAVQLDESTSEATALGFSAISAITRNERRFLLAGATIPLEMRYVLLVQRTPAAGEKAARRKVYVGSLGATIWANGNNVITLDGIAWNVTRKIGESRFDIPGNDTEQTDGDVDANDQQGA